MSHPIHILDLERRFRFEYTVLQQDINEYLGEVSDLITLLPKWRAKRGLIDAGGHVLKYLFGTLEEDDLVVIDNDMEYLYQSNRDLIHEQEKRATVITNMQSDIVSHAKTINNIVKTLQSYHSTMHNTLTTLFKREDLVKSQMKNLFSYLKLNTVISDAKSTVSSAIQKMSKFHQAIEELAGGKLSSKLLPPHKFIEILQEIEKIIPPPTKLYLPVNMETIHEYYAIADVHSYATVHTLRIILQLPLRNDDRLFQEYSVYTYPVYDMTLERWRQWDVPTQKIVISKDRLLFTTYDTLSFMQNCKGIQLRVCPLSEILFSVEDRPNCAVELFMGKLSKLCNRKLISGLKSPILLKTPSHWVYSTSKAHKVTLNCYENGRLNVTSMVLDGVGVITQVNWCDVISEDYKVPARIHGSSVHVGNFSRILFPDLKNMLSDEETDVIFSDRNATIEVLERLDKELSTVDIKEYPIDKVLLDIRSHKKYKTVKNNVMKVVGTCVIIMICVTLMYACYSKVVGQAATWRIRCCSRRHVPRTASQAWELGHGPCNTDVELQGDVQAEDISRSNGGPSEIDETPQPVGRIKVIVRK